MNIKPWNDYLVHTFVNLNTLFFTLLFCIDSQQALYLNKYAMAGRYLVDIIHRVAYQVIEQCYTDWLWMKNLQQLLHRSWIAKDTLAASWIFKNKPCVIIILQNVWQRTTGNEFCLELTINIFTRHYRCNFVWSPKRK